MNLVASVPPSMNALMPEPLDLWAKKNHQSKVFVCVSNNRAGAVDQLLMAECILSFMTW